jgi:antibiotic biosynthesis monooxygenase (ABM) superfamily enzyme
MAVETATDEIVTLVTQTQVLPGHDAEFAAWQREMSAAVAAIPGFLDATVREPAPPTQLDWVVIQRFRSRDAAQAWLQSPERQRLLAAIEPILVGRDDIHLFTGAPGRPPDTMVSAVISTSVASGREAEFRAWQKRIAAAEAAFPGFQGAKLEPPIPGVQDDWATVVRFDSDEHLKAWLESPQRRRLIEEARDFGAESRVRTVRGGFEGWFTVGGGPGAAPPPAWKQNLVVLLVLYPVVFLLGAWIEIPYLMKQGVPRWISLFLANIVSVILMGYLIMPWVSRRLDWWLSPRVGAPRWTTAAGVALIVGLLVISFVIFAQFPPP